MSSLLPPAGRPEWPLHYREALKLLGTREVLGSASNPVILAWAKEVGFARLGIPYTTDATPWCGLFAAVCFTRAGLEPPPIAVRALQWAKIGTPVAQPQVGDVLVFRRPGGGHVGFYEAEDATHYWTLGGNQADGVNTMRIEKSRCTARRRPPGVADLGPAGIVRRDRSAAAPPVSRDEA